MGELETTVELLKKELHDQICQSISSCIDTEENRNAYKDDTRINWVLSQLDTPTVIDDDHFEQIHNFLMYTTELDDRRNTNFTEIPELETKYDAV